MVALTHMSSASCWGYCAQPLLTSLKYGHSSITHKKERKKETQTRVANLCNGGWLPQQLLGPDDEVVCKGSDGGGGGSGGGGKVYKGYLALDFSLKKLKVNKGKSFKF